MATLLKGAEAAKALTEKLAARAEELKSKGVEPCLAIVRVGERDDDLSYERGAMKRCEKVGIAVKNVVLPVDVTQEALIAEIEKINADINAVIDTEDFRQRVAAIDVTVEQTTLEEFADIISSEIVMWGKLAEERNITAD